MKKWKSKLFPVITLAVCLGLAACGGGAESEGSSDDQEDYEETENSAPESFEGMVKDPDITAVYDMYWGTWIGEDDSELIVGLNGSGEDRFEWYDEDDNLVRFEHVMTIEYEGENYVLLAPLDEDEEGDEVIILRIEEQDGEEVYATLEDDDLINAVFSRYLEIVEEEDEDEN